MTSDKQSLSGGFGLDTNGNLPISLLAGNMAKQKQIKDSQLQNSDVASLTWPESPGFGLAWEGLGLTKSRPRP